MRGRGLLLVMSLVACRQDNPDWMGPDPSVGGDAGGSDGTTTDEPATGTGAASSDGNGSSGSTDGSTCDPDTQMLCGTVCKNILEDRKNCGDCGNMCVGGDLCVDGVCG